MAQIAILIFLIVLAFFLIRGFARGNLHEKKRVYNLEIDDFPLIVEKWEEITTSLPYAENIKGNDDTEDGHQNTTYCKRYLIQCTASAQERYG